MKISGTEALIGGLRKRATLADVKNTVKLNGSELERAMKRNASFTKGYQTGTTKRSIGLAFSEGGYTAKVAPTTHYSPYLEVGTRFMSAQPFVRPSFLIQRQKFINDMQRLMR